MSVKARSRTCLQVLAFTASTAIAACATGAVPGAPAAASPAASAATTPTRIVTHVVTHDAKLIGSAVGGVRITVRDAATGDLLAEGLHEGSTGDTRRIVTEPRRRGESVFETPGAGRWATTLALTGPTMVDVAAEGPLGYPDQMVRATKRLLLVPGQHVEGDGIVLEMHGYLIDVQSPDTATAARGGSPLPVRARVRLLCSCPTQPGGMWEVEAVRARLKQQGRIVAETPLAYAGTESTYEGTLPAAPAGAYELEIIAASPRTATFGRVERRVVLR